MTRFYRGLLLILLAVVPGSLAMHQPTLGAELLSKYSVLAVGINNYQSKELNPLRGCVNDATSIAAMFDGANAALLLENGVTEASVLAARGRNNKTVLLDSEATLANIMDAFDKLGKSVSEKSDVLIYLSGHGLRLDRDWTFCTHDFDPSKPAETGLKGLHIRIAIDQLMRKHCRILMILDSCNSGEFVKSCEAEFRDHTRPEGAGLIVLASSAPTQSSWDGASRWDGAIHSLFTFEVLSAFSLMGDMNNRDISLPENRTVKIALNEVRRTLSQNLRTAVFNLPKFPGLLHSEQEFLGDWSMSISDTQVLVEYAAPDIRTAEGRQFYVPPQRAERRVPFDLPEEVIVHVGKAEDTLDGVWKWERPIIVRTASGAIPDEGTPPAFVTDAAGNQLLEVLMLRFDGRGSYEVVHRIGHEPPISNSGRYDYQPGRLFQLQYANGCDSLGLKSLTAEELVIEYDPLEFKNRNLENFWSPENIQTLRFERVILQ